MKNLIIFTNAVKTMTFLCPGSILDFFRDKKLPNIYRPQKKSCRRGQITRKNPKVTVWRRKCLFCALFFSLPRGHLCLCLEKIVYQIDECSFPFPSLNNLPIYPHCSLNEFEEKIRVIEIEICKRKLSFFRLGA